MKNNIYLFLLAAMVMMVLPQKAYATHVDESYNYMVTPNGMNKFSIQCAAYDQRDADCMITDGKLKITVGGTEYVLFKWGRKNETVDDDDTQINFKFKTEVDGYIEVTQGNTSKYFTLTQTDGEVEKAVYANNDKRTYSISATWTVPYTWLGETVTFSWDITRDGPARYEEKVTVNSSTYTIPQAEAIVNPQVTPAIISYSQPGKLELPWFMSSTKIDSARYEYVDGNGEKQTVAMEKNVNSGIIYLDACTPHNQFSIIMDYRDNNDNAIKNVHSESTDLSMIHGPVGFLASPRGDDKARVDLKWEINHRNAPDFMPTDFFEIQRSLTGKEEDFVNVGTVNYNSQDSVYSFTDTLLLSAISKGQLSADGNLENLTYRVRRTMTSPWGWGSDNTAAAATSCSLDFLHLLRIADYTAQWEDSASYTARVSWTYADEYHAVWDERAQMLMRVTQTNRAGEVTATDEYILTQAERNQRYKIVSLQAPCVNYKVELLVNRGSSPLLLAEEIDSLIFPIRTEADWNAFCDSVEAAGGNKPVYARLYNDIAVSRMAGISLDKPYRGIFDGNGHTITASINNNTQYTSLFSHVKDATFRNLHVAGNIESSAMYASGLIGIEDNGKVLIENCRVSATITNTINGDASSGGFIGGVGVSTAQITFRNCVFNGRLEGENCHSNGGFAGWSNSILHIENCLFDPVHIGTKFDFCETWTRGVTPTVSNSYATVGYDGKTFLISSADDWLKFAQIVDEEAGSKDVNAMLTADISTTATVGWNESAPYRGTFDGRGHTLDITYNMLSNPAYKDAKYLAPFRYTSDCTIKNLRVTGSVYSEESTAGLIGSVVGSPTINIDNVRVSGEFRKIRILSACFIGDAKGAKVNIEDCLSDGNINREMPNAKFAAFIGCGGEGRWTFNRVYENCWLPDVNNYYGFCYDSYDGKWWGYNSYSTNCRSAHNFPEMYNDWFRNQTNQDSIVIWNNREQADSWTLENGKAVPVMETTHTGNLTQAQLLEKLGNRWKMENGKLVPAAYTSYDPATAVQPSLPTFYHESSGKLDPELLPETRQSSVVLSWNTDGKPIDYFTVYRRIKDGPDTTWTEIATNIEVLSYEDKEVSPIRTYEYKVSGTIDCEGKRFQWTKVKPGECKHTGLIEGYVRFNDGTGIPGIEVKIVPQDPQYGSGVSVFTDAQGHYKAEDLSYFGQSEITYNVTPVGEGVVEFRPTGFAATFDSISNYRTPNDFINVKGLRFSANVMYEGTSIPVKGAHFRVNGHDVYNAQNKLITTDFTGYAEFNVLSNYKNKIQVVMDDHVFVNNGYYKSADGVYMSDNATNIYFYDSTLVCLTGRVVGGDDQGSLPLGNNLSHNNLGENLTMVLTLEGDNTSWLVYDNTDPLITQRDVTFPHPAGNGHQTTAEVFRKRMVVKPDSATGEYRLMLPPVRWKVTQVYCKGYPTLFQDGMVSEVIDLTDALKENTVTYSGKYMSVDNEVVDNPTATYNAVYNRIYHAPIEILYNQIGYDTISYFGDKSYLAQTVGGRTDTVPLVYAQAGNTAYTFGYPVFSLERQYPIELSVVERYPWNGDADSKNVEIVHIGGGEVTIHNGLKNGVSTDVVKLDSMGMGVYYLQGEQTTRLLSGEDALRTVSLTLRQDGTTYEAAPLKGYLLNIFATSNTKDVLADSIPLLIDILRDPPGTSSSATLSKGSKLKYSYTLDMALKGGMSFSWTKGTKMDGYQGQHVATPGTTHAGLITHSENHNVMNLDIVFDMAGKKGYTYTVNVNEDITTSSSATMVGADADIYIGMVQNMYVTPLSTIRAIPDSVYKIMVGRLKGGSMDAAVDKYGSLVHIAEGTILQGKDTLKYHLVRDESVGYGATVTSQFTHSQKYILDQLIPNQIKQLRALMFKGSAGEAQAQADATGKPVYRSLVGIDHENFAIANTRNDSAFYYTYTENVPDDPDMNYVIHLPKACNTTPPDEVALRCQIIFAWLKMIANNEAEKLNATDKVANYDVDGGSKLTYSETFESEYTVSEYMHFPFAKTGDFYDNGSNYVTEALTLATPTIKSLLKLYKVLDRESGEVTGGAYGNYDNDRKLISVELTFAGTLNKFNLTPIFDYSCKDFAGSTQTYSRKESFNISMDNKSHLNFDLYRAASGDTTLAANGLSHVFTNANYENSSKFVLEHIVKGQNINGIRYPKGFVYRTRGGATCNTWEDQRTTLVYHPGTILDERTKKICNPKITLDKQSVSGIAITEPARFTAYLTNDSEYPEAASGTIALFCIYLEETKNPYGAKIYMDGSPLNSAGINIMIKPGQVIQKTIEVYAGAEFDYEDLRIGVTSPSDWVKTACEVSFDVHYLREAGPVRIASPADKWLMNASSERNDRGWFIPVTINGFNKHQHNFDHIEFQYKESKRGEDAWTNLRSYYANDTLMAKASGEKEMIPENGNIVAEFYGEGPVTEKGYDLRAVLFCRNGNSFLTSYSPVLSGVKDTRLPQLFGTPEPANGIIGIGDNIIFNFSEDIEYNYLSHITNFEVKGEVNNANVAEAVSVLFSGNSSVETEARRNLSNKDFTINMMIYPEATGADMPLFSHGTNGSKLQLWLTSDSILRAVIGDSVYTARKAIKTGGFTQIALAMQRPAGDRKGLLTFYNGGVILDTFRILESYNGVGPLIFGRTNETNRARSTYYRGRMMEARLWYRALTGGEVGTTYGGRRLTGYEMGLVDYYPMNEGTGTYALDHAQGANARLINAGWAMPRGWSLRTDGHAVRLDENALNRTAEQDYTLMFWFKTDEQGRGVLLGNTGITGDENKNHFCIGFDGAELVYRSAGQEYKLGSGYSDNAWHHYTMTVNRAHNIANIYIDRALKASFSPDVLGGISGGIQAISADINGFTGNLDELCFFAQALPFSLIERYATKSPAGDEAGLMTYLSFDRQERQKDNDIELVAYPYSRRIYLDNNNQVVYQLDPTTKEPTTTPKRDYLFVDSITTILPLIVNSTAAPVAPAEELKNIAFSFAGKDNQVLVNINELASRINRRNIYVTLRDVEDKNGNAMASPATAVYFVNNSTLRWTEKRVDRTTFYGNEEQVYFELENISATSHTFTIENCPKWLTLDTYTDVITAQNKVTIMGTINKGLNVGTYDEVLYLTDENGVSEPLYFTLTVEGEQPEWTNNIDHELLQNSMNIIGRVFVRGEIDIDNRDIVGAFDRLGKCHGFANIHYSAQTGESNLYLTVYDNRVSGNDLYFKLWQYSTGREMMLTMPTDDNPVRDAIPFQSGAVMGTDVPVRFEADNKYVQTFHLKEGWNWISFNVTNAERLNLNTLLDGLPWKEGDVLTDMNSTATFIYRDGHWLASTGKNYAISPKCAYAVKVSEKTSFPIAGNIIRQMDLRTISVKSGWNGIGYTPMYNLPVETALSDYFDKAQPGDVIKSHNEFAYFTKVAGVGRWKGSLEYMKPGEGYMLLRKADNDTKFIYPFYEPNSTFIDEWSYSTVRSAAPARQSTMSVSAIVEGVSLQEGDRLVALAYSERIGETVAKDSVFYLTVSNDVQSAIRFAIERDGVIIATSDEQMTYRANAVIGSPDQPVLISFRNKGIEDGNSTETDCGCGTKGWFTVLGVMLPNEPTEPGVYIHNCKKVVVK
ncbi:MAG: LamG domain-containing protein [Paludibacteraceae bacterium]|nr:LamG domain-containing protein [Paludibacteraceae bacterium]